MSSFKHLELPRKTNKKKEEYKYFVGSTEKNALSYKAGEAIVFKFRAKHMDSYLPVPFVHYSILTEDGKSEDGCKACAEDGWFYIETSISKNGFVYLKAQACNEELGTCLNSVLRSARIGFGIATDQGANRWFIVGQASHIARVHTILVDLHNPIIISIVYICQDIFITIIETIVALDTIRI